MSVYIACDDVMLIALEWFQYQHSVPLKPIIYVSLLSNHACIITVHVKVPTMKIQYILIPTHFWDLKFIKLTENQTNFVITDRKDMWFLNQAHTAKGRAHLVS